VKQHGLFVSRFLDNFVRRGFRFVDEIGVKDIELEMFSFVRFIRTKTNLIALYDLRRRIVNAAAC